MVWSKFVTFMSINKVEMADFGTNNTMKGINNKSAYPFLVVSALVRAVIEGLYLIRNCTRRLRWRFSSESLGAIGLLCPSPRWAMLASVAP